MNIVFLGPPGCGKGTQSQVLSDTFLHLSTGDLLRSEITSKSPLGLEISGIMAKGSLVGDDIIIALIKKNIDQSYKKDVLFDGFPRTIVQAETFDNMLSGLSQKVDLVVNFNISDDILVGRISGRFNCKSCRSVYHDVTNKPKVDGVCDKCGSSDFVRRDDDRPEELKQRLKAYKENTLPLIQFYKGKNVLFEVEASLPLEEVKKNISDKIKDLIKE